jgi:undecaprenyl-diphosphatase
MGFLESLTVGVVQGVTEWLPLSSEGMTSLVLTQAFGSSLQEAILIALWLHLGTLCAAVIFFRKDIVQVFRKRDEVFTFLIVGTAVSLVLGGLIVIFLLEAFAFSGQGIMILIGILLIITGVIQYFSKHSTALEKKATKRDAVVTGLVQGFAVLPGLSRSGLTVSVLLLRKYSAPVALRLSFLMSIPVVAVAGVWAFMKNPASGAVEAGTALGASFVIGLLTIAVLMKVAARVNFSVFTVLIGILSLIAGLV